jgi:hypothetical protein
MATKKQKTGTEGQYEIFEVWRGNNKSKAKKHYGIKKKGNKRITKLHGSKGAARTAAKRLSAKQAKAGATGRKKKSGGRKKK